MCLRAISLPSLAARQWENTEEYRIFKKQLYHTSIAKILEPLRPGMTTPHVLLCPDGHYRRTIFEIGPFIADYPEQVYLSGIVQGWCPKYVARFEVAVSRMTFTHGYPGASPCLIEFSSPAMHALETLRRRRRRRILLKNNGTSSASTPTSR